jgi:hypothetical protein
LRYLEAREGIVKAKPKCCINCRLCRLEADFYGGSHYVCEKTGQFLISAVVKLKTCRGFQPFPESKPAA